MPYGVTAEMMAAWGPVIFDLSLNKQVRLGDPIRKLDHAAWSAQRDATGLSDDEIAERVGLARPQVTFIRNVTERRIFRINQYRKLYRMGGGKRWRPDEHVDPEEAFAIRPEAAILRQALTFDPERVADFVASGAWTGDTAWSLASRHGAETGDAAAVGDGAESATWAALAATAESIAAGLAASGIRRGEAVAVGLPAGRTLIGAVFGVLRLGGAVLPLPPDLSAETMMAFLHTGRVRAVIYDPLGIGADPDLVPRCQRRLPSLEHLVTPEGGGDALSLSALADAPPDKRLAAPAGGEPAVLIPAGGQKPVLVPHTHQTLLASARMLLRALDDAVPSTVAWAGAIDEPGFWIAFAVASATGAALRRSEGTEAAMTLRPHDAEGLVAHHGAKRIRVLAKPQALTPLVGVSGDDEGRETDWQAPPGHEVCVMDSEGPSSAPGQSGPLWARGPSCAPAFVDDPAATGTAFTRDGWVAIGLDGTLGSDGRVRLAA